MENTYTKGPWVTGVGHWDESTGLNSALAIFEKSEVPSEGSATAICLISPIDKVNPTDMANAKLIVAAPEMLEALQKIANWELPETGQFWDDDKSSPVSYTAEHGTEGAKRFIQNIAKNILKKLY